MSADHRYVIRFAKEGYICYTSHLDLLRLFKRAFKRAGISLAYSQGFNPHPKMSFAQPLSLGYAGAAELLEAETQEAYAPERLKALLTAEMPAGITILACEENRHEKRSLAARTRAAEYQILIPQPADMNLTAATGEDFLRQPEILVQKKQKKTGKMNEIDIRGQIRSLTVTSAENELCLQAVLDSGSQSNLSPELLITAFLAFTGLAVPRTSIRVIRKRLIFEK